MKKIVLTSSMKSPFSGDRSETPRESFYFPGCRKDTNCHCEICLASIKATLDLMPSSIQESSLTKISLPKSTPSKTPYSSDRRIPVTSHIPASPFRSTAKSRPVVKKKGGESWNIGSVFWRFVLGLSLIFALDFGFPWVVSGIFRLNLSHEIVRGVTEECGGVENLKGRLGVFERKLGEIVHGRVSNCSDADSIWELNQDGFRLLRSRCILYKSAAEEVIIWGWPLQTAGLLVAGFSSRSFTILSGRITEWPEGKMERFDRKVNSSWINRKWTASAVHLEPNTWIIEYRRSPILENSQIFRAAMNFLYFRILRLFEELEQEFWLWKIDFPFQQRSYGAQEDFKYPT
ncbi:C-8 sterol isomerase [Tasmannia lanceolata]|uniref:C-8 sterol isomerase n=1 Tax=Tasmannia lanceolata TaxID=3420 RepID=UPI00406390B1